MKTEADQHQTKYFPMTFEDAFPGRVDANPRVKNVLKKDGHGTMKLLFQQKIPV